MYSAHSLLPELAPIQPLSAQYNNTTHYTLHPTHTTEHDVHPHSVTQPAHDKLAEASRYIAQLAESIRWDIYGALKDLLATDLNLLHDLTNHHSIAGTQRHITVLNWLLNTLLQPNSGGTTYGADQQNELNDSVDDGKKHKKRDGTGKRSRGWNEADEQHITQLRASGMSFPDIAKQTGRTMGSVKKHYYKMTRGNTPNKRQADESSDALQLDDRLEQPAHHAHHQHQHQQTASPQLHAAQYEGSGNMQPHTDMMHTDELIAAQNMGSPRVQHDMQQLSVAGDVGSPSLLSQSHEPAPAPLPNKKVQPPGAHGPVVVWKDEERQQADALKSQGKTTNEIASILRRSVKSVDGYFKRLRAKQRKAQAAASQTHHNEHSSNNTPTLNSPQSQSHSPSLQHQYPQHSMSDMLSSDAAIPPLPISNQ